MKFIGQEKLLGRKSLRVQIENDNLGLHALLGAAPAAEKPRSRASSRA